jgi:hypothetical protein
MRCSGDVEGIDATLAARARGECALRLRLGQLLEVLGRGPVFDLGFSSIGAYGVERCERSVRWVEAARCLARRVEVLPKTRRAVATGEVSWTMGELLARVATPADESRWLELARCRTVRQVRRLVEDAVSAARAVDAAKAKARAVAPDPVASRGEREVAGAEPCGSEGDAGAGTEAARDEAAAGEAGANEAGANRVAGDDASESEAADEDIELCTLTCTVDREDAWLFEATRCLLDQLGERHPHAQAEAMLAEAQGTLLELLPRGTLDGDCSQQRGFAQVSWEEALRRCRREAEVACEANILAGIAGSRGLRGHPSDVASDASLGMAQLEQGSCTSLDRQVCAIADALARHELDFSALVLRFHRADGWRKLGYASETQYALERLGLSRSSFVARRALALRLERLPGVAAALGAAHIGVEAALQIVRIATPNTEAAWVARARRRTIKHLREEVAAALVAVRCAGEVDCDPPEDAELAAFQELEQAVVSGRFTSPSRRSDPAGEGVPVRPARSLDEPVTEPRKAWFVMLGSLAGWLRGELQMSAAAPGAAASRVCSRAGRVTLRLCMSREAAAWWRGLEAQARRWLQPGLSWLRFVCLSVWHGWHHVLGTRVAYRHIFVRDRFRCTSPVCMRRDVTPHHIEFRSAGGSDDATNLTSPCTWCHLHGVHGGRIRASGTAERIRWELGPKRAPSLIVDGRERQLRADFRP